MILITIGLIAMLGIGVLIMYTVEWESVAFGIYLVCGLALLIIAFAWPITYISGIDDFKKYESTKQTIEAARNGDISDIERAALTTKIIEINQSIASAKYWNDTIFDRAIYDKYAEAEPLK